MFANSVATLSTILSMWGGGEGGRGWDRGADLGETQTWRGSQYV